MAVSVKRPNERVERSALMQAYGLISEAVSARRDVKDAVILVLGYEQDRIATGPFMDLEPGKAHAMSCFAFGKQEGLDRAALVLLDSEHIANERARLDEMNKETES
jgi:hypothetical protein